MIRYLTGDATDPQVPGNKVIAHVCNNIGVWSRGFVMSLSKRWHEPELSYRRWYQDQENALMTPGWSHMKAGVKMELGTVQLVPVRTSFAEKTWVANMIAQHGIMTKDGEPPIRYDALETCLQQLKKFTDYEGHVTVHMPRIGCGLAGGKWEKIEPIVTRALSGVCVYVYDLLPVQH
jgi:O-acetyl-ADP-ribose deacetylase (regulator of RNase III)